MYTTKLTYRLNADSELTTIEFPIVDYYVNINPNGSSCRVHLPGAMDAQLEELMASFIEITFMEIINNAGNTVYSSTYWKCMTGLHSQPGENDNADGVHALYFEHEDNRFIEAE